MPQVFIFLDQCSAGSPSLWKKQLKTTGVPISTSKIWHSEASSQIPRDLFLVSYPDENPGSRLKSPLLFSTFFFFHMFQSLRFVFPKFLPTCIYFSGWKTWLSHGSAGWQHFQFYTCRTFAPRKATVRGNEKAGELSEELAHVLNVSLCRRLPQRYIMTQILKAATAHSGASQDLALLFCLQHH